MDCACTNIHVYRDPEEVAAQAAGWLHHLASASTGRFSISLSGGSTPKLLYENLAQPPYLERFPWRRVHWFWGDERFVPPNHPDSNFRMVHDALLGASPAPRENIHPVKTSLATPAASADDYQKRLWQFSGSKRPVSGKALFDIVLLGVGDDGHTASLYPQAAALKETRRLVAPVVGSRKEPRITLTLPALRSSGHVAFLVCGAEKQKIVSDIFFGADLPASRVRSDGMIHWFLDAAAAPRQDLAQIE
jgi:6-phosphogluconolactonase